MNRQSRRILRHLSSSVLLRESSSPALLRLILIFLIAIVGFFVYWSTHIELNQVVIASGEVMTREDIVNVQHSQGGVIKEIHVSEGDLVNEGDLLITLDDTLLSARIREERSRIHNYNQRLNLLKEELDIKKSLLDQELISRTSYLTLQRLHTETVGERTQAYYRLERYRYLISQLIVVSPIYGSVYTSKKHSSGTIIKAGETIFEIIPFDRELTAELRLPAKDRGKVTVGQKTLLKFTSYDYTKYGGLTGEINSISVITFSDGNNRPYYKVNVDLPVCYIGNDNSKLNILPGMTLSGEISMGSKNLLEYLILPVKAASDGAFNEP